MREDRDTIDSLELAELGEAMLDLVSGGRFPTIDPDG